jgi:cytochrome P450
MTVESAATVDPPVMDVDFYTAEMAADPWPTVKRIREAGPIVWNERGFWMSARDRVCRQVLNRPGILGQKPIISSIFGEESFVAIDDKARHNALRNVWAVAFRRDTLDALRPLVRQLTSDMLDPVIERLHDGETVDMVPAICRHLPAYVIGHMMGVSNDDLPDVVRWSDRMAEASTGDFQGDFESNERWLASEQAKLDLADFLRGQIDYRRRHPGDDLISQIVYSDVAGTLSDEAIMINTRQLLFAGNETTANWIGQNIRVLGDRPDLRRELEAEPALIPQAVEEILRLDSVVQLLPRDVHAADVVIADTHLPEGTRVMMLLGGANRDPERYERPDELDIRREGLASLAFGFNLHSCLGVTLARLEAAETTAVLVDRLPAYKVGAGLRYSAFSMRGPAVLPISLN